MSQLVRYFGTLRIADGPLKGKKHYGGDEQFLFVDEAQCVAYLYQAIWPPHRRLKKRCSYFLQRSIKLRKNEVQDVMYMNTLWRGTKRIARERREGE